MKVIVTFIVLSLIVFSCKKENKDTYVQLSYKQTQCSDPWMYGNSDSLTLLNVSHYLDSLHLYVAGLQIKLDSTAELCTACSCKTGKIIYVTTLELDKNNYSISVFK